jgi:hypothetical protein
MFSAAEYKAGAISSEKERVLERDWRVAYPAAVLDRLKRGSNK